MELNELTGIIIHSAIEVHRQLGPGLFESVYENALIYEITSLGLEAVQQLPIPVSYKGIEMPIGFRADILVENRVIIEIKSVEMLHNVHKKQVLTYLRLTNKQVGLLINFNEALIKRGLVRLFNNHYRV
jgi:GxxExxY protein